MLKAHNHGVGPLYIYRHVWLCLVFWPWTNNLNDLSWPRNQLIWAKKKRYKYLPWTTRNPSSPMAHPPPHNGQLPQHDFHPQRPVVQPGSGFQSRVCRKCSSSRLAQLPVMFPEVASFMNYGEVRNTQHTCFIVYPHRCNVCAIVESEAWHSKTHEDVPAVQWLTCQAATQWKPSIDYK